MPSEELVFTSRGNRLAGTLYQPIEGAPHPALVAVHTASGGERSDPYYDHLKTWLTRHGIATLIFDRSGSGASAGSFQTADFTDLAEDVVAAAECLQTRPDIDPHRIGLHGTSQGAWIAPIAAVRKPEIALIVAVSASGVSPAEQMDYGVAVHLAQAGFDQSVVDQAIALRQLVNGYFRGQLSREAVASALSRHEHEAWFQPAYLFTSARLPQDVRSSKWHYELDYQPLPIWSQVQQPTLFLFAGEDAWVPIEQSIGNYRQVTAAQPDVTLQQIPGTDHLMRDQQGQISSGYLQTLVAWLGVRFALSATS